MYALPSAVASAGSSNPLASAVGTSLERSSLDAQVQLTSTLLSGLSSPDTSSSLFAGASALSLLNAQGTAAMKYLTPQTPPPGQNLNALA
jgi:hypothetical protein